MALPVAELNDILATVPINGDYNLQVSVAGQMGFARTQQGRLQIAAGQASSPRTTLSFQSTVQRLVAGGKRAALPLVARGQLRVEGDLGQLEELRRELQPHMSRLQAAAEALMSSETTAVRWLPDEATECCMAESCGRPFTLLRRRHHCRGCGQIFCDTCSPLRGAPAQRRCASCWAKKTAPALGPMGLMGPMPEALTAGDSSPALPKDKGSTTDLLVEFHVEDSLASIRFWWRASAALSSACVIGFLATFTQERLLMLSPLLLVAFFLRRWLLRYAEVAWLCTVIFTKIFSARLRASGRPPQAAEAIWALCHKVCARFVFDTVVSLGGFWVKLAQTASVVSALPDAYVDELSKLQDSMPADSLELVEKLLTKELGSTWREHIQLDPGPVLGSATIAQVHKATFRLPKDGGVQEIQGVVKVQHAHVEEKLLVDIRASVLVGRLMTSLMPHMFSDVGATIQDTAAMSKAELDFRMEARNQEMARARIQEAGLDITVPAVIPEYVTKRVLAMEFVKGVKITEYAKAESSTARRKEVMAKLIDFYGFTLHGPIFNCDPHPGNILVDKETGRLCVLDWGQVRQLSQPERFAYAKIFMAALMEDVHLFVEGCRALDFEFGDLDGPPDATPIAMIGALRFLLRDSRPIAQSRADFEQLEQVFGKLDGETKAIQKGGEQIVKGPLMPLTKTVSLLFEVSSRLEVSLPLMHLFVCHGYPMLLKEQGHTNVKVQPSMTSFTLKLPVMQQSLGTGSDLGLVSKFSQLLRALHADGHLLGAQLCVLDLATGATLVDLALGHSSWLNPLPVTADTLFNILEISKMFLSFSVLRLVEQGRVSLKTVLQESSKGKVSLENALSHTSGHLKLAPGGSELSFRDFCDMDVLAKKMVAEEPLLAPGIRQQYQHTSFGLLVQEACKLANTNLSAAWKSFADEANATLLLHSPSSPYAQPVSQMRSPSLEDLGKRMEEFEHFIDATNRGKSKTATAGQKAEHGMWMSFFGREHWFNPAALNREIPKTHVLPGRQAFATAKDTAKALRAAHGTCLSQRMWNEAARSRKPPKGGDSEPCRLPHHLERFQNAEWGLGLQRLRLPDDREVLGHAACNGSFAVLLPNQSRPVVAAFLVNRSDGAVAAERILSALAEM